MACVYYIKGRINPFTSELELEDFLMQKGELYAKYKDLVFSISEQQIKADELIKKHGKETSELRKKMNTFMHSTRAEFDDDGNLLNGEVAPYTGVNKFLGAVRNINGDHMVPEFNSDNLWKNLREKFEKGEYSKDVAEYLFGPGDDGTTHKLAKGDDATFKDYRKRITRKWKEQAYTGTAIHEVLQLLFQKVSGESEEYKIRLQTLGANPDADRRKIHGMLKPENAERVSLDQISQVIDIAKTFYDQLNSSLQGPLTFYTEMSLTAKSHIGASKCTQQLYGIADLVVIDKHGQTHIVDYKTSIHAFSDYSSAKQITVFHQIGLYQRMLSDLGLRMKDKKAYVLPIQMDGFHLDETTDKFSFENCKTEGLRDITVQLTNEKTQANLNEILPFKYSISIPADQILTKVKDRMARLFPTYSDRRKVDDKWLRDKINEAGGFTPNKDGNLSYTYGGGSGKTFVVKAGPDAEATLMAQVKKYIEDDRNLRMIKYDATVAALKEGIENETSEVKFPSASANHHGLSATWFKERFAKYCNKQWEVVDCDAAEQFGVIMLRNVITNELDIKRISTQNLDYGLYNAKTFQEAEGNKGKNFDIMKNLCAGIGRDDVYFQSQADSLIAEATIGNIEIIETMLLLNALGDVGDVKVTGIEVMNPGSAQGIALSNEELAYNWKALNDIDPIEVDNFKNGNIQLASKYQLAFNTFKSIMQEGKASGFKGEIYQFAGYTDALSSFYDAIENPEQQIRELEKLRKRLEDDFAADTESVKDSNLQKKHMQLYNQVIIALADKRGIKFRQQLRDHSKWLESTNILTKGISGTYTDNPGNLSSETLNTITKMVTQAYQITRDDMQRKMIKISKLVENLKKAKGFGSLQTHALGNQTDLYANMTQHTPDGDFVFVDPSTLDTQEERDFLEFVLNEINHNRYSNYTESELQKMRDEHDIRYFRVPLEVASESSKHSQKGLLSNIKEIFRYLNPKYAWEQARMKAEGVFEASKDLKQQQANENFYHMINRFNVANDESPDRIKRIADMGGIANIEHNLETLVIKHDLAYSMKENMDSVFPMIKAAMIHLTMSAALQNDPSGFKNDRQYLKEYVMNKIFNQSIIDPRYQGVAETLTSLRYAASLATLALSPVQFFYQMLQGLFTDIRLFITQPDGNQSFTFHNMTKAAKLVYADMFRDSSHPTLFMKINELYGLNDMDMNTYGDKIKSDRFGIHNFTNFLMKFSSRPDYYNRCVIFGSQMEADGCLDAHKLVDGVLKYDFKADKRFTLLVNGHTSDPMYKHQKALYDVMAEQFELEGVKDENGNPWVREPGKFKPLPRAYTNKQAESMKSLADNIYGYYSHEKKSLIQSTLIGSMWMQFRTYWSGKKNLFLAPGGVTLQGHYKQIEKPETGEKLYYQVDKNNNVRRDLEPVTEDTGYPVYKWVGDWREGVMLQLSTMAKSMYDTGSIQEGFSSMWYNSNKDVRERFRSNIKQITTDLMMWILFGTIISGFLREWLKDAMNENKKSDDFMAGLGLSAANIAIASLRNASFDFNFMDSIGTPITNWTPFAFEWTGKQVSNWLKIATGDEDFWDGCINTFSASRQFKPAFDAIKPDIFRNEREK